MTRGCAQEIHDACACAIDTVEKHSHIRALLAVLLLFLLLWCTIANAGQKQPDAKRVKEIQTALIAHGYEPGSAWSATQEILRHIAEDHGWQTHRSPDARVLILLGLGNKYSNPEVVLQGHSRLDGEVPVDGIACCSANLCATQHHHDKKAQ